MTFDDQKFDEFAWFCNERQRIFVKRHIEGEKPPWTNDPILQNRHFCNLYRETDRVSSWYINNWVGQGYDIPDVFLNTLMFRIFNQPKVFELIGFQHIEDWDRKWIINTINEERERGLTAFRSSYMVTGAVGGKDSDKVESYTNFVFHPVKRNIDRFVTPIEDGWDPNSATNKWTEIKGISDFLAYEIYTDITYHDWSPWTENDYVNPGPGARRGIQRLYDFDEIDANKHKDIDYVWDIMKLRDMDWLDEDLYYEGKVPTLRTTEHSLCEYSKYCRAKDRKERGKSVSMKRFNPNAEDIGIENENQTLAKQTGFGDY